MRPEPRRGDLPSPLPGRGPGGGGLPPRHRITVIIPVADRPRQLANILASLLELCRTFPYGDDDGGRQHHVAVLVADDSADAAAIRRHREIAQEVEAQGLPVLYFGATEQAALLHALPAAQRQALQHVVGEPETTGFRHKGAAVTRNLASLLAWQMSGAADDRLFMFVDSDEQFKVRIAASPQDRDVFAINYFDCLDRIFASGDVDVLTGKVVGDPPVSPAVMTGNFLADVIGLLEAMASVDPSSPCAFHAASAQVGDAAYHDMADLFGFVPATDPFSYRCTLIGDHNHALCLADFAAKLDHFFDGEHPTRSSTYLPGAAGIDLQPARTVYTGNYVCNRAGLVHFIPFAPLKLRMAGPVLGRLIRAAIGPRFVSANLPLLHTRTVHGDAEFRPGVSRAAANVDLAGEFERQFFGDVMLFTVERLVGMGYPAHTPGIETIRQILDATAGELQEKYSAKRALILTRLDLAITCFNASQRWWNLAADSRKTRANFQRFFANIRHNFGMDSNCHHLIADPVHRADRLTEMAQALACGSGDTAAWRAALASLQ